MNWTLLIAAVAVVIVLVLRRLLFLPASRAQDLLRAGAVVIDVRSADEFGSGHLPGAVNMPWDSLRTEAPKKLGKKDQVLLLHCLSGTRSGIAARQLKQLGYTSCFNLGSYRRAEQLVRAAKK